MEAEAVSRSEQSEEGRPFPPLPHHWEKLPQHSSQITAWTFPEAPELSESFSLACGYRNYCSLNGHFQNPRTNICTSGVVTKAERRRHQTLLPQPFFPPRLGCSLPDKAQGAARTPSVVLVPRGATLTGQQAMTCAHASVFTPNQCSGRLSMSILPLSLQSPYGSPAQRAGGSVLLQSCS